MSTLLQFKWKQSPSKIVDSLRDSLKESFEEFRQKMAERIFEEVATQWTGPSFGNEYYKTSKYGKSGKIPADTGTFVHSWKQPKDVGNTTELVNKLPSSYVGATRGMYHQAGEAITEPYNQYILEGFKAGAPREFMTTFHDWEYMNRVEGKLLDMSILLWKYEQGALGESPFILLNSIMRAKMRKLAK